MRRALVTMTGAALCATSFLLGCGDSGGDTGGAGGSGSVTNVTSVTSVTSTHATNTVGSTTSTVAVTSAVTSTTTTSDASSSSTTDASSSTTASSSSTGLMAICGDGVVAAGEGCDDGNTTDGDGCSATCAAETGYLCTGTGPSVCTLGGTCANPLPITGNSFTFVVPNLSAFGDDNNFTDTTCKHGSSAAGTHPDVVFQVSLLANETIHVTDSGDADLLFHVVTGACDNATACAASYDGITNSDEENPGLVYTSPIAQSAYLVIDSYTSNPPTTADVALDVELSLCGDGVLGGAEQCDDGGVTAGNGCDATCHVELGYSCAGSPSVCTPVPAASCASPIVVTGNSFEYANPNINSYGDDQNYNAGANCESTSTTAPNGADVTFLANLTAGQSVTVRELGPLDALIHIIQPPLCVTGSACAASIDFGETTGVSYTATVDGPVYVVVEAWGNPTPANAAFDVAIDITTCGDGILTSNETCDDGNNTAGDGCSASCQIEAGSICSGTPSICQNLSACTTASCALGTCAGTIVTGVAAQAPIAIPDDDDVVGASLSIPIVATGNITAVAVHFDATHTYDGDVSLYLTAPGASETDISTNNGGSQNNYTGTIFRDGLPPIDSGTPPFTGIFESQTPFAGFNGQSVTGTWAFRVTDNAAGDTGTVNALDIAFCVTP